MISKYFNRKILSILIVARIINQCNTFEYNPELSKRLASYSLLSYCSHKRILDWSCGEPCQRVESFKDIILNFNENNFSYMMGYDQHQDALTIIARGSNPWCISDWHDDLSTEKEDYPKCESCQVHKEFYQAFLSMKEQIIKDFLYLRQKYPQSKIHVTGYSLGGAFATLIVPEIYKLNNKQPLDAFYTFGSPRVGNLQFSFWYSSKSFFSKSCARVTNNHDLVPQLPPRSFPFLYKHIGHEVYYKDFSNFDDYAKCETPDEEVCTDKYSKEKNVKDHGGYFGWNWAFDIFTC